MQRLTCLYDFLQSVHELLGVPLYARKCYVCFYDAARHCKGSPYDVDERDGNALQCALPQRRLTEFVLRTATPQMIDAARLETLRSKGEVRYLLPQVVSPQDRMGKRANTLQTLFFAT